MSPLEGRLQVLQAPGIWLWIALALGAAIRAFLVVATPGTDDVAIWQSHGGWTHQHGLVGYYGRSEVFNHPPFMGFLMSKAWELAKAADIPFGVPLRAPFALLDLGSAWLLLLLFRDSPWRWASAASYWLNPLAILYSSYHGNTDSGVAFFMLLAVLLASRRRAAWAGVAVGVGLWVKLPTILVAPAIFFFLRDWRTRAVFVGVALGVGASTYLPVALEAPSLLYQRVIAYPGRVMATPDGTPIWGIWSLFGIFDALPASWRFHLHPWIDAHLRFNTLVCLAPIVLLAWLRRRETTTRGLGATVCGSLLVFQGFTNNLWAWQYLAWMIPFWIFLGARFTALATAVIGGYVYGVYAYLCGDLLLTGPWRFKSTPSWPIGLMLARDASVLLCFVSAWVFLALAARREWLLRARGAP